jgi:hypothetical protein
MLFILCVMQILTWNAEYVHHQTSTGIPHCHSSFVYPQWKDLVCAKNSHDALRVSVTFATTFVVC